MSFKDRLQAASEKFQKDQETAEIVRAAQRTAKKEAEKLACVNETFIQPVINGLPNQQKFLDYVEKNGPLEKYRVTKINFNILHEVMSKGEYEDIKAELDEIVSEKYDGALILKLYLHKDNSGQYGYCSWDEAYFYLAS